MTSLLAQAAAAAPEPSTAELIVFVIVGAVALGSALSVVMLRNAIHAALMLVVNFFTIAVFYAVLEAQFLGVVQIIVYAGAIMVLFLFVIMLLGVDREDDRTGDRIAGQKPIAVIFGLLLFTALTVGVAGPYLTAESACPTGAPTAGSEALPCVGLEQANGESNVAAIGALLFSKYVWPFEVASVLLVIAALGAMVLGRKTEDPADLVDRLPDDDIGEVEEPVPAAVAASTVEGEPDSPPVPGQPSTPEDPPMPDGSMSEYEEGE